MRPKTPTKAVNKINGFVNVQVRVLTAQAQTQLNQIQSTMNGMQKSFGNASKGASSFSSIIGGMPLDSFGSKLQWAGRQLEYSFTLPVAAAGAAAFKMALDHEAAFTRISKVYGDASMDAGVMRNELNALSGAFEQLSNSYGVNQTEVLGVAAAWAAAGASGEALARSVDLTMKTMILGEIEAAKATEALIAIQAQYGLNVQELTKTIATLNVVENQTGISLAGLVDGFSRAAGVARSAGVDVRHLAAMMAALVPATGSAGAAGNALKTIFSRLQSPTKETVEVLGLMGIQYDSLQWKSANMVDQLGILVKSFESLSDKQKGVVSSVIASRWQINKFEVLMRDMANANGYYQRALEATADQTAVYAQMQRELNAVLSSNPRRLQILWTTLQNALADIITPLIPMLLWATEAIQRMVTAFSNLSPGVQKAALAFLVFIAAVGPVVRILGAVFLLVAEVGTAFMAVVTPIGAAGLAIWTFVKAPIVGFLTSIGNGVRWLIMSFAPLGPVIASSATIIVNVLRNAVFVMGLLWMTSGSYLLGMTKAAWLLIGKAIAGAMIGINKIIAMGTTQFNKLWALGLSGIAAIQKGFAFMMALTWGKMWAGIVSLTIAGFVKLQALFVGFIPAIRAFSTAVMAAMTGPWGIAISIVVLLLLAFWDEVKAIWFAMVRGTVAAFNALPAGIRGALVAVVNMVKSAVMAVYKLFSYLNPWARHSPSLVENVTTGMAEIRKQYATASGIGEIFRRAGTDLAAFGRAIAGVKRIAEQTEFAEMRTNLAAVAADAIPYFNQLVRVLYPLRDALADINDDLVAQQAIVDRWQDSLDAANNKLKDQQYILDQLQTVADGYASQLEHAQSQLDHFASAPIKGMRAMEDAIFANEMAQKRLRLEMMNLEDAIGPVDELEDRLAAINGQIEMLSGEQAALRNAGAGSEILGQYEDQISALEDQREAIDASMQPILDLQDQLEELARAGERLDLENSLAFDDLLRQIEQATSTSKELTFEEILAGITKYKAEVDQLSTSYEEANKAVEEQQKVVDALTASKDAIQNRYDLEYEYLQSIQGEYDEVEGRIRDIEQALNDVGSAAESITRAREAAKKAGGSGSMSPGAENFLGAAGGNFPDPGMDAQIGREGGLGDQSSMIDDFTKELQNMTADMFGAFSFLEPIRKAWNIAVAWLKENVGASFSALGAEVGTAFEGMNPLAGAGEWVETAKRVASDVTGFMKSVWELIGPSVIDIARNAWASLQEAFRTIQPEVEKFRDLVGPMGEALANIWTILKPVMAVAVGIFLLALKTILSVLAETIGPAIEMVTGLVTGIIRVIRGILEFVIGVFTLDWQMAWQGIVDIFGGIWDAISSVLSGAVGIIWGIVKGLVTGIFDFFVWLWDELVGHSVVPDMINGIIDWFKKLADLVRPIVDTFTKWIKSAWENIVKPAFDAWMNVLRALRDLFFAVVAALSGQWDVAVNRARSAADAVRGTVDNIKNFFSGMKDSIVNTFNKVKDSIESFISKVNSIRGRFSFGGLFNGLVGAFASAINTIIGKWNSLNFGVGPLSVGTPDIPFLARGGFVTEGATAIVGEGRKGYPEFVIPTDPMYRRRAVGLFKQLGDQLGISDVLKDATLIRGIENFMGMSASSLRASQFLAAGGTIGSMRKRATRTSSLGVHAEYSTFNFYGNLEFPNVSDGDDAEEFLANLEAIIRGK
jgi:TP901 family phage tail tape measure protein